MYYRKDKNHNQIVYELKQLNISVWELHNVGGGMSDLIIGYAFTNFLIEIKTDKGRQSDSQKLFEQYWQGQYKIVHNTDEILDYLLDYFLKSSLNKKIKNNLINELKNKKEILKDIVFIPKPKRKSKSNKKKGDNSGITNN